MLVGSMLIKKWSHLKLWKRKAAHSTRIVKSHKCNLVTLELQIFMKWITFSVACYFIFHAARQVFCFHLQFVFLASMRLGSSRKWILNCGYMQRYVYLTQYSLWMLIAFKPVRRLCVLVAVSASINSDSLLVIWGAKRKGKNNGAKIMIFMNGDKNSCVTPTNIVIIPVNQVNGNWKHTTKLIAHLSFALPFYI